MTRLAALVVLVHVGIAFWLVSGILGRAFAFARARRATEIGVAHAMLSLSERFDRLMVIPGGSSVVAFGLLAWWLRGWPATNDPAGVHVGWLWSAVALYLTLVPFIPLFLAPKSRRRAAVVAAAVAEGRITPELTAEIEDRGLHRYRAWELFVVAAIVTLMVTRPF